MQHLLNSALRNWKKSERGYEQDIREEEDLAGGVDMNPREYLEILHVAERLKDTPRHCTTTKRRTESVAEHSWRISLMAFLLRYEFKDFDIDKVVDMCLIHDLGECFTGDIPTFIKTDADREVEDSLLNQWVKTLPKELADVIIALYKEMGRAAYHNPMIQMGNCDSMLKKAYETHMNEEWIRETRAKTDAVCKEFYFADVYSCPVCGQKNKREKAAFRQQRKRDKRHAFGG